MSVKLSDEERIRRRKESNLKWVQNNKEHLKETQTQWRLLNKEKRHTQQRERAQNFKKKAIEFCGNVCAHCGGSFPPAVYDFHHTNPEEKEVNISKIMSHSWESIVVELSKCVLLCSNCHRIEHNKDSN